MQFQTIANNRYSFLSMFIFSCCKFILYSLKFPLMFSLLEKVKRNIVKKWLLVYTALEPYAYYKGTNRGLKNITARSEPIVTMRLSLFQHK